MKKKATKKTPVENPISGKEVFSAPAPNQSLFNDDLRKTSPPSASNSPERHLRNVTPLDVALVAATISSATAMDSKRACAKAINLILEASQQLDEKLNPTSPPQRPQSPLQTPEVRRRVAKRLNELHSNGSAKAGQSSRQREPDGSNLFPILWEELRKLDGEVDERTCRKRIETAFRDEDERKTIWKKGLTEDQFERLLKFPAWRKVKKIVEAIETKALEPIETEIAEISPLYLDP